MEKKGKILIEVEKEDVNGVTINEVIAINYKYHTGQFNPEIKINAYDLARLVELLEVPNFEATGLRLQIKLILEGGEEKMGEVNLPEHIRKASPAQLREIGDQPEDD